MLTRLLCLFATSCCLLSATVRAQDSRPTGAASYALLIGSNPGGAQQETLRYAEEDARRMAEVATQLGGYDPARVRILLTPTRASLLAALDDIEAVMDSHARREEPSRLLFYYSGHARSDALMLGDEDVPLVALRERLQGLPASLTLVILDACQSGAFSRVKGAGPAADFSINSAQRLGVEGIAVMASSTGTELSQESDVLHGSFFTHHLSVGLRGAADTNHDGKVSLEEAYSYAYHHTLTATSATAVGGQHPTFEANLRGKGDVALSYLADASASVVLPGPLAGQVVIQNIETGSVAAELHKTAGESMEVALPPGEYDAVVKNAQSISRCPLVLTEHTTQGLDEDQCTTVLQEAAVGKGEDSPEDSHWGLEMLVGSTIEGSARVQGSVASTYRFAENFSVASNFKYAIDRDWWRGSSVQLRFQKTFGDGMFTLFAQGGAGAIVVPSPIFEATWVDPWATVLRASAEAGTGIYIMPWHHKGRSKWHRMGFVAQVDAALVVEREPYVVPQAYVGWRMWF